MTDSPFIQLEQPKKEYGGLKMTEKRFKEVIFQWKDSGGEYCYERRIVKNTEEKELSE